MKIVQKTRKHNVNVNENAKSWMLKCSQTEIPNGKFILPNWRHIQSNAELYVHIEENGNGGRRYDENIFLDFV